MDGAVVDVVVGVVLRGDKFLVECRGLDERLDPGVVCLPGGHVEAGESFEGALKREMHEELGINVKRLKFVCTAFRVASNGERQRSYCFLITDYEGEPACMSAKEVYWESNVGNLSLEEDRKVIRKARELQSVLR